MELCSLGVRRGGCTGAVLVLLRTRASTATHMFDDGRSGVGAVPARASFNDLVVWRQPADVPCNHKQVANAVSSRLEWRSGAHPQRAACGASSARRQQSIAPRTPPPPSASRTMATRMMCSPSAALRAPLPRAARRAVAPPAATALRTAGAAALASARPGPARPAAPGCRTADARSAQACCCCARRCRRALRQTLCSPRPRRWRAWRAATRR